MPDNEGMFVEQTNEGMSSDGRQEKKEGGCSTDLMANPQHYYK